MKLEPKYIILLLFFSYCFTAVAQIPIKQSIVVDLSGISNLENVLDVLEEKTSYTFAYGDLSNEDCNVHLAQLNAPLVDILDEIFIPCNIEWNIIGEHIILTKRIKKTLKISIKGKIIDQLTGKGIEFATVYIPDSPYGTQTDADGNYELSEIALKSFLLKYSMLGYISYEKKISKNVQSKHIINITLVPKDISLDAAIFRYDRISDQTTISKITLDKSDLDGNLNISDDPLKAIAQLPSVAGNGDLLSSDQLYIRGGEPNENLLLLDNVRFLWPYYLGGTSIFNPDVLKDVEIMSGEFQSKYGNAMSGIINMTTRNGNMEKFKANIGVSGFHNSFLVEGPFKKNKSSYLVAFRKTNKLSLFNNPITPPKSNDFSIKLFFQLSKNHRLSYTNLTVTDQLNLKNIFFGQDSLRLPLSSNNQIGGQSLQWQATFFGNVYNKFSIHQSNQLINLSFEQPKYPTIKQLNNDHLSMRNDLSTYIDDNTKMDAGFEFNIDHYRGVSKELYNATDIQIADSNLLYLRNEINLPRTYIASYFNIDHKFYNKWQTIYGLRIDLSNNFYLLTLSPRWNISYTYNSKLKLTGFTGLFRQDPTIDSLINLSNFKPNQVWQSNLGAQYKLNKNTYFWVEAYSKYYKNLVVFGRDSKFSNNGSSKVFGIELFAQRELNGLLMRLGYSLSKADRKRTFQLETHSFHFDQRHRLNYYLKYIKSSHRYKYLPKYYVLNYRLTSGTPYTAISNYALVDSIFVPQFGAINAERNGWYNNLNLKLTWEYRLGKRKRTRIQIFLEYWNLLNTKNLSRRIYSPDPNMPTNVQTSIQYHEGRIPNLGIKFWFNESGDRE